MKGRMETQAAVSGEGRYPAVSGCVRVSPMECGSVVQTHVRGLPCPDGFIGMCVEICGREYRLPPLLSCRGEAIASVYICTFTPEETNGGRIVLSVDDWGNGGRMCIASGRFAPVGRSDCRPQIPPRLYGQIRW